MKKFKPLLTKTGLTRTCTYDQWKASQIIPKSYGEVTIRYHDDKQANKIARAMVRLAKNPHIKLNVRFEKI